MGPKTAFAKGTFDPEIFKNSAYGKNALQMQEIYNKYATTPMHPDVLTYWEEKGAKKELYEEGTPGAWSVFTPVDMDMTKKYPLIYCSHGGGDDIFLAETYGYTELVQPMQVICVYPQNGDFANRQIETEFPRILYELEAKGYPIDCSRVYAVGFSAGSVASLRLAMSEPKALAGIAAVPGSNSFRGGLLTKLLPDYAKNYGYQMPLMCIGGTQDGGDSFPLEEDAYYHNINLWMQNVAKVKDFAPHSLAMAQDLMTSSCDTVKRTFGLNFHQTWIEYAEETFWYCGEFYGHKGEAVARFIGIDGLPHIHCKGLAKEIFHYLRQFSRDTTTGELIYTSRSINHAKNS